MIKREVIEKVDKPFFPIFDRKGMLIGTDISFYEKALRLGFKCWIEPRIIAGHIGYQSFLMGDYYALKDADALKLDNVQFKEV